MNTNTDPDSYETDGSLSGKNDLPRDVSGARPDDDMGSDRILDLLEAVFATEDDEIDCGTFMEIVARHIDAEIAADVDHDVDPRFHTHIRQCRECAELYRALRFAAALEASGELPDANELWTELEALAARKQPSDKMAAAEPAETAVRKGIQPTAASTGLPQPDGVDQSAYGPGGRNEARPEVKRESRRRSSERRDLLPPWWPFGTAPGTRAFVATGALSLLLAFGWWDTSQEAHRLKEAVYMIGHAEEIRFSQSGDGMWARVLFAPDSEKFFVATGGMPDEGLDKPIKCWLVKASGERWEAGEFTPHSRSDWWMLEGEQPLESYDAFVISDDEDDMIQMSLR